MSVDKLLAAMGDEARIKSTAILDEAREKASAILAKAEAEASLLRMAAARRRDETEKIRHTVHAARELMVKRRLILAAQTTAIDALFEKCRAMFGAFMDSPEYAAFIRRNYDAVSRICEVEKIFADKRTATVLREMGVADVAADDAVSGGFVAIADGGRMTVHATFDALARKLWRDKGCEFVAKITENTGDGT